MDKTWSNLSGRLSIINSNSYNYLDYPRGVEIMLEIYKSGRFDLVEVVFWQYKGFPKGEWPIFITRFRSIWFYLDFLKSYEIDFKENYLFEFHL